MSEGTDDSQDDRIEEGEQYDQPDADDSPESTDAETNDPTDNGSEGRDSTADGDATDSASDDPPTDDPPTDDPDPDHDEEGTDRDRPDRVDDHRASRRDPHPHTRPGTPPSDGDRDDGHWLTSLLAALERLEGSSSSSASGRHRGDRAIVDYDISIGTPFDSSDDDSDDSDDSDESNRFDANSFDDANEGRPRKRRRRNPSSDHLVTTRESEDELLVTADVAGADPDEVTVGFDDSSLVVAVSGSELDRIEVPWPDPAADAAIKNGILTVRLTPEESTDE